MKIYWRLCWQVVIFRAIQGDRQAESHSLSVSCFADRNQELNDARNACWIPWRVCEHFDCTKVHSRSMKNSESCLYAISSIEFNSQSSWIYSWNGDRSDRLQPSTRTKTILAIHRMTIWKDCPWYRSTDHNCFLMMKFEVRQCWRRWQTEESESWKSSHNRHNEMISQKKTFTSCRYREMKEQIVRLYDNPNERQEAFFNSCAKYRLYWWQKWWWKSRAMRREVVNQCLSWKVRWLVLRRTTEEIQENMLQPMMLELPWRLYERREKRGVMKFKPTWSTVKFWYCRNLKDVLQYQWVEFDFICIEELTHRSEEEFRILMSSLRSSKKYVKPNFFWSTNPWWRWHGRVKRLRINRDFNAEEDPTEYDFIQASVYDNKFLLENNPEYLKSLLALPEKLRRAYLEGDRDVFAWQFFTEFRRSIHVIETPYIPHEWVVRRIICVDYWFTNPAAVYRLAQDSQGEVVCYRELYTTWKTYKQLYLQARAMTTWREKIDFVVADPAVVNKKSESWWMTFKQTRSWRRVIPGKNARVDWRWLMRDYIHETVTWNGLSLKFTSNCTAAIRTIPELVHDDLNVEDVNTKGEDHAGDAIRYWLVALWRKKTTKVNVLKKSDKITVDWINKMIAKQRKTDTYKSNNPVSKTF